MAGLTMMLVMMGSFSYGSGSFETAYVIVISVIPVEIILAFILMRVIRNTQFKKLDKTYEEMLKGKIPLK